MHGLSLVPDVLAVHQVRGHLVAEHDGHAVVLVAVQPLVYSLEGVPVGLTQNALVCPVDRGQFPFKLGEVCFLGLPYFAPSSTQIPVVEVYRDTLGPLAGG
jgi:hypothetical protein